MVGDGLNNCWMSVRGHRHRAGLIMTLASTFSSAKTPLKALKSLLIVSTVAATSALLAKTLCRNAEWSSRTTLFT